LILLGTYVDALYVSVKGILRRGVIEGFTEMKLEARNAGEEKYYSISGLPDRTFRLSPRGREKYQFILRSDAFYLEITEWANLPALMIQFDSHTLYTHSLDELQNMVDDVAKYFLEPGYEIRVNRFDLALDFQRATWHLPTPEDVIARARDRKVHFQQSHPICLTVGNHRSRLQFQIYDKLREVKSSQKDWMYEVWRESARYEEKLGVWRVELRFRRKKLREFGISTIAELQAALGSLVRGVVGGDEAKPWIRVASSDTRGKRQDHRPSAAWWGEICEAFLESLPETASHLDPAQRGDLRLERDETMVFAFFERWMIQGGGEGLSPASDPHECFDLLAEKYSEHLASEGLSFEEAIERRAIKMGLAPVISGVG